MSDDFSRDSLILFGEVWALPESKQIVVDTVWFMHVLDMETGETLYSSVFHNKEEINQYFYTVAKIDEKTMLVRCEDRKFDLVEVLCEEQDEYVWVDSQNFHDVEIIHPRKMPVWIKDKEADRYINIETKAQFTGRAGLYIIHPEWTTKGIRDNLYLMHDDLKEKHLIELPGENEECNDAVCAEGKLFVIGVKGVYCYEEGTEEIKWIRDIKSLLNEKEK